MKSLLIFFVFSIFIHLNTYAQCHNPTITPSVPILCPNETDTLWTQSYDSYQWYKDGNLIINETKHYLVVDLDSFALANITVAATVSDSTKFSPSVLVDGWAFLLPFVINGGDYNFVNGIFATNIASLEK